MLSLNRRLRHTVRSAILEVASKRMKTGELARRRSGSLWTRTNPMQTIDVDPPALRGNRDRMRQSESSPQADASILAASSSHLIHGAVRGSTDDLLGRSKRYLLRNKN